MMKIRKIFLETTIMVGILCKEKETKRKINEVLSKYDEKYTSRYVKMEFKKGFLQHLVYLHGKIVNSENFSDVFKAISKLSSTQQRYKLGSVLEAITTFFSEIGDLPLENLKIPEMLEKDGMTYGEYNKIMVEQYLSNLIRRSWRKFETVVDEISNEMSCFIDIQPPIKKGNLYDNKPRTCDKSDFKCDVHVFFKNNTDAFTRILNKLEALENEESDTETKKRIKSLKQILRVIKRKINYKDCWHCGDAIISVEAPKQSDVFTINIKHFKPICEAINKNVISYTP